jgi:RNA polymerase sigma-70 factor, ECF subfamily
MARNTASVSASVRTDRTSERALDRGVRVAVGPCPTRAPLRFDEAVRVHEPTLTRLAERLCRSHADARDLVQDTYERALRAWDRLPEDSNVRAWLVTILHNLFLDRCRRARRNPRMDEAGPARALDVPSPETTAPQPWAEVTADQVRAAVSELDVEFRRAYEMYALEGRSYRQIADELGIPTNTVGTRLLRARMKLKRILLHHIEAGGRGEAK